MKGDKEVKDMETVQNLQEDGASRLPEWDLADTVIYGASLLMIIAFAIFMICTDKPEPEQPMPVPYETIYLC